MLNYNKGNAQERKWELNTSLCLLKVHANTIHTSNIHHLGD